MKLHAMLVSVVLAGMTTSARATPFDDLASPLPNIRADAAKQIREQHWEPPTSRDHWVQVFAAIDVTKPDSVVTLIDRLPSSPNGTKWAPKDFSREAVVSFPLDSFWLIAFSMHEGRLMQFEIKPREIRVEPPSGFSGFWSTYRADGTPAANYDYDHGHNLGDTLNMK